MIHVTVGEAQADLPKYLAEVARGNTVVVLDHDRPVAEIRPAVLAPRQPRPIGLGKDVFQVPPFFFEPLPHELIAAFHGDAK